MCIRDRLKYAQIPTAIALALSHGTNDAQKTMGVITMGLVAVSYTHLRAHETVLDLVCRLLLEKKTYQYIHLFIYSNHTT